MKNLTRKEVYGVSFAVVVLIGIVLVYALRPKDAPETIQYVEQGPIFVYENGEEETGKLNPTPVECDYESAVNPLPIVHRDEAPCGGYYYIPEFGAVYYNWNDTSWLVTRNKGSFTVYPEEKDYARDQSHVYYQADRIPYADPESFQPVVVGEDAELLNSASANLSLGYDTHQLYEGTESLLIELNGVKPIILVALGMQSAYIAVGNKIYYYNHDTMIDDNGGVEETLVFKFVRETEVTPVFEVAGENPNTLTRFYQDQEGYLYFDTGRIVKR